MKTESILKNAAKLVSGDRAKAYGDKKILHDKIATMWSAYTDYNIKHVRYVRTYSIRVRLISTACK